MTETERSALVAEVNHHSALEGLKPTFEGAADQADFVAGAITGNELVDRALKRHTPQVSVEV